MSAKTGRLRINMWNGRQSRAVRTRGEVMILTLDMALGEFFAKDALFKESSLQKEAREWWAGNPV